MFIYINSINQKNCNMLLFLLHCMYCTASCTFEGKKCFVENLTQPEKHPGQRSEREK